MAEHDRLSDQFEANRAHMRAVAYRMLGSLSDADDAVQEAWLRLSRSGAGGISNLGGWLTTVVARVCLNMLQSRRARREESLDAHFPDEMVQAARGPNPEDEALLADAVGPALLVVLDTLAPAERLAFVLHDVFAVSFDEIAPIVGRSPTATRQLASRARRRVRGQSAALDSDVDLTRQRAVVDAFLAASRAGDFEALLALLDPEVVLRADDAGVAVGAWSGVRGARDVAGRFAGVRGARPALLRGAVGAVWAPGGQPRVAFVFTITDGKIVAIDFIANPEHLRRLDPVVLDA